MKCLAILFVLASCYLVTLYLYREFSPVQMERMLLSDVLCDEPEGVRDILNQPFAYLDMGKQMTAYESRDGKHVLKLFHPREPIPKEWFFRPRKVQKLFSLKWISSALWQKKERLQKLYDRYALAFREMREETGLVYVHLQPSSRLPVQMIDRDATSYRVDLAHMPFVLQKKVELAQVRLTRLASDPAGLQACYEQLRALFTHRAKKGITDRIQTLHNNYGFVDNKAVQIDVGRLRIDPQIAAAPDGEVERIMARIEGAP